MTTTAVKNFFAKVSEDQALQGEMFKALEAENDREAVTALAQANGYEFTSDELWAEIQARQAEFEQRQAAGEFSDEELEAVTGGGTPLLGIAVIAGLNSLSISIHAGIPPAKW